MRTVDLNSWTEFPDAVSGIRAEFGTRTIDVPEKDAVTLDNQILFRGQADSGWRLQTTLERAADSPITVQYYLQRENSCVNEIESVTGRQWNLKSYPEIKTEIEDYQDFMRVHVPHYDYLVYLRHHGFPSPLLDWTTSPYVAAYFALETANNADRAAVFAFIETPEGHKAGRGNSNMIRTHGPYVTTHTRHFAQKAWYTTATHWDTQAKKHTFCSHHDVTPGAIVKQDVLIKLTIPRVDRVAALKQLDEYNINHYTLFQTEDALVRTMGLRAFDIDGT
ncbi:FRG domain-containing protein [Stieleria varia]|uniref:FRG domain protein n=1 Tax=Stieleria varia TaxID=2528005 RepID=A0A5C6AZH9_9BACT|nr:FRG domain-containing protein [Stieleria varia]TWU04426.1 FRG domain protein [Stieleria varia]